MRCTTYRKAYFFCKRINGNTVLHHEALASDRRIRGWRFSCVRNTKTKTEKGKNAMDFETFKDSLAEDVREKLEGKTGEKYSVEVHNIDKMNESYEALTVKPENSVVGVNINATALYEQIQQGESYESIADKAAFIVETALENRPDFNLDELTDYDKMKQTLAMEVVSAERNADLLERVPHRNIEDMAVVYRFVLNDDESGRGTILVTNKMLEDYGVSADQLHEDAMKNAPEIKPAIIRGMSEVLGQQMGVEDLASIGLDIPPEEEMMFVATVEGNIHGAGVIAYQDFMEKASERVGGGDFFILPSSVHELLIVPDNGTMDLKHLEDMVKEVNATTVDPVDQLTDSVYHYDSKDKIFELGEKFVERQAAKEEARGKEAGDRKSVLGDLKTAKDEASKQVKKDVIDKATKAKGGEAI